MFEEIPFDPHSKFWDFRDELVDDYGDPLDLLVKAEEGDENAVEMLREQRTRRQKA